MDWTSGMRDDRLVFEMVDPNDLDSSRGELTGVVRDGSSLTFAYDTDLLMSGELKIIDAPFIENSLIRIHLYVDKDDYHDELGTFFVTSDDLELNHGVYSGTLELSSRLVALSDDVWIRNFTIPKGSSAISVLADLLESYGLEHSFDQSISDYVYNDSNIFTFGENVLDTVLDICEKLKARLSINGHGIILLNPIIDDALKNPVFEIDGGFVIGAVTVKDETYSMPSRIGVINKSEDGTEIIAYADVPTYSPAARSRRGRRITKTYELSDMPVASYVHAAKEAQARLDEESSGARTFTFRSLYIPLREGNVVDFRFMSIRAKCVTKTIELSLAPGLAQQLTIREV